MPPSGAARADCELGSDGTLRIALAGPWLLAGARPAFAQVERELAAPGVRRVRFDASRLGAWDSALLTFVTRIYESCVRSQIAAELGGLPAGARRLVALAEAVPERVGARASEVRPPWLARVGQALLAAEAAAGSALELIGEVSVAGAHLLRGRARFQGSQFALALQQCGPQALPIVSLISFLVGLILAFMSAVQLLRFGAQIYVADLVALAMLREMGPIMTAIAMAGRTGAAFAAQLGTMKGSQEIDALATFGIDPIEYLVLPRVLALSLALPLLCLYADALGILGGLAVSGSLLQLSLVQYWNETAASLRLGDLAFGVFKGGLFGVLIALAGCGFGIRCGGSASAVGDATTRAVVASLVLIIAADGALAVLANLLGI